METNVPRTAMSEAYVDSESSNTGGMLEDICSETFWDILDEVMLGLCFEIHRQVKLGTFFLDDTDEENMKQYEIVDKIGYDVFGQVPMKKQFECMCPNCNRTMAASRFAPHLEKCMGMGRNSSRIASRRIANSGKGDSDDEDNDNDNDWSFHADKKASKKKKVDKSGNSPRRSKVTKLKNGDIPSVGSCASDGSGPNINYDTMPYGSAKKCDKKTKSLKKSKKAMMLSFDVSLSDSRSPLS